MCLHCNSVLVRLFVIVGRDPAYALNPGSETLCRSSGLAQYEDGRKLVGVCKCMHDM